MSTVTEKIIPILIEEEMKNSYIDYSMSVIISRALPDVRDGLKPVHRRVLYGMLELGVRPNSPYKKSARIVGEVLGKYHPHGDTAVYDTMVRMVQDFSLRYPLVDGQGNFGSVDGDSAAAMRYTEARLAPIAEEVLRDIDKDTVPFVPNFDESLKEPSILPSLLPGLLVNGASGIAVGMATNIPPHNLGEVVDALIALIGRPAMKVGSLRKYLQGPDFPTGGIIFGDTGITEYFSTGRGKLTVRAKAHVEEMRGARERIVVTELPYQVNKATLQEKVAALVRDRKIDGISEVRDESDREGMRVVFELRKEISAEKILKDLFKHTQMETTFGVIMLALVDGQPQILNIKQALQEFLSFRHEIVLRRTKFELDKAERRAHILEGYIIALDNIDEVIAIIKKSRNVDTARSNLMKRFKLSQIQAQAILDMRLQRLTGLERRKIEQEYKELIKLIEKFKAILASKALRMQVVKEELLALKEKYDDPRRTQIIAKKSKAALKELIKEEEYVVALYHSGIIKRFSFSEYQNEKSLLKPTKQRDYLEFATLAVAGQFILLFSNKGKCYPVRTSYISSSEAGKPLNRLIPLDANETIVSMIEVTKFDDQQYVVLGSREGQVKRLLLSTLSKPKDGGLVVMSLKGDDSVVNAFVTTGALDIVMATSQGMAIRFSEQDVRDMGLLAGGVRGIMLSKDDLVTGIIPLCKTKSTLLSITDFGFGKRSRVDEYSKIRRGGKGVINYKVTEKGGLVIALLEVVDSDYIIMTTKKQRIKRQRAKLIKIMGRATQGTPLVAIAQNDKIAKAFCNPQNRLKK